MEDQVEQLQVHLLLYFVNEQHEKVMQVQNDSIYQKIEQFNFSIETKIYFFNNINHL